MCMRRGELPANRFLKRQPAALTLLRKGDSDCRREMKDDGGVPGFAGAVLWTQYWNVIWLGWKRTVTM